MRYACINAWARYFQDKEGIQIGYRAIRDRLKKAEIIGIAGRDKVGRVLNFYPEPEVRKLCNDLISPDIPRADESGFFEKGGVRYGTISRLAKAIGISAKAIYKRLKTSFVRPVKGRVANGNIFEFYSEPDVLRLCSDLLGELPHANEDGFFEKDGIRYGNICAFIDLLNISKKPIVKRIRELSIKFIKGKNIQGKVSHYYSEPDVRQACADLLDKTLPQADEHGFFKENGKQFGTVEAWSRTLPLANVTIRKRLARSNQKGVMGRVMSGNLVSFYSKSNVLSACADLLDKALHQADKDGFFERGGETYGSAIAWGRILPISDATVAARIRKARKQAIKGKDAIGRVYDFYSEPDVRFACADLLLARRSASVGGAKHNPHAA